ncbi:hypothetical protein ALNOE001_05230 [Candidatus Methanobinarius endosymbioticus]|uniref:HTH cro/C1-type domain-containing protein n=1 Tax=Candidatus Methanobinarius endosymbioticus TaxID=2006182 RepID=A0A366MCK6_9EURY|nr:hypothetical protein ALNOE001_05230 [Candidatus Methanobinarius endosymbioticus]
MIKELRKELNLTQADLAKKVGVSKQTLNAIEKRKIPPNFRHSM